MLAASTFKYARYSVPSPRNISISLRFAPRRARILGLSILFLSDDVWLRRIKDGYFFVVAQRRGRPGSRYLLFASPKRRYQEKGDRRLLPFGFPNSVRWKGERCKLASLEQAFFLSPSSARCLAAVPSGIQKQKTKPCYLTVHDSIRVTKFCCNASITLCSAHGTSASWFWY